MAPTKKVILHYFDLGSKGCGEVVRLILRELRINFEDKRYAYNDTWAKLSKTYQEKGLSVAGKLPVLEMDGHILSQHIPLLRYLSRSAGNYDGSSSYDNWLADAVSDIYVDWRAAMPETLKALKKAISERPNVKEYIASRL
ncbi:hypothetical protein PV05_07710 [Exophiala xenobiotica]|uniref:GST N-terminal domain-containing protein n=1 Tax=Exophiala xenobiotica TaxID=348802 RepID=A0A0D2CQ24_9EURO|nr:uncharacterized protein PV05_07710 [Exophiala xenobiotica]KIW52037.1 hypothetical protein PV05_07710 [Exophiala xenobiotica]